MPQFHRWTRRRCFVVKDLSLSIVERKSELFQLQTNFMEAASKCGVYAASAHI